MSRRKEQDNRRRIFHILIFLDNCSKIKLPTLTTSNTPTLGNLGRLEI